MRGAFVLVVAAGVALAAGWSVVRRAAEEPDADAAPADAHADPGRDSGSPPAVAPDATPRGGATPRTFSVEEARALLDAGPAALSDAATRGTWIAAGDALLASADSAATQAGTDRRTLARRLFAGVYGCDASSASERDTAYARSRELFDVLVRGSGAAPELVLRHQVQPGQSVWALARGPWKQAGASVAPGFVLWLNGVQDARKVRAGQTLKVPLEPLTLLVRKRRFELTVLLGGAPVERFAVAVGPDAKTPVGRFAVKDCLRNPDWYQNGRRIPFGSPGHIIGTRWIGFTGAPAADGIGLHGTTDDYSIGTATSQGCVRMRNAEVERVFEWVMSGTIVEIRD